MRALVSGRKAIAEVSLPVSEPYEIKQQAAKSMSDLITSLAELTNSPGYVGMASGQLVPGMASPGAPPGGVGRSHHCCYLTVLFAQQRLEMSRCWCENTSSTRCTRDLASMQTAFGTLRCRSKLAMPLLRTEEFRIRVQEDERCQSLAQSRVQKSIG